MRKCWSCGREMSGDSQSEQGLWKCEGCGWVSSYTDESPIQSLDVLKIERLLNTRQESES